MILGEVEETITTVEIDEETFEELFKVCLNYHVQSASESVWTLYMLKAGKPL